MHKDRMNNNECLRAKTEDLLGVETKLFAPAVSNGVIPGLLGGTMDLAWLGASGFASTSLSDPGAVEPVLVKVTVAGGYGYFSVGFAGKARGFSSLAGMVGR
jgi:ABC-type phosphate/phosphonate transport system, periplasmic component